MAASVTLKIFNEDIMSILKIFFNEPSFYITRLVAEIHTYKEYLATI